MLFDIQAHRAALQKEKDQYLHLVKFWQRVITKAKPYDGKVLNKNIAAALSDDEISAHISGSGADRELRIYPKFDYNHMITFRCGGRYASRPIIKDNNRFDFENFRKIACHSIEWYRKDIADLDKELLADESLYNEVEQAKKYYSYMLSKLSDYTTTHKKSALNLG